MLMELRDYQKRISEEATAIIDLYGLAYLSMQCRTGKSITALETARRCGAKHVLWVTKKKAIPSIWADYEALGKPFILEVTNYESVHKYLFCGADFVVIDEAHSIGKFPKAGVHQKDLRTIAKDLPCLFLSATPSPESYSQLYHQFQISNRSPWAKHSNFYKWVNAGYVTPKTVYHPMPAKDYSCANVEMIKKDVQHLFISYTQEEAGFEVNIDEHRYIVPMTARITQAQKDLRKYGFAKIKMSDGAEETVIADTPAKLMQKLHQLGSGTIKNGDKYLVLDKSKAIAIKHKFENQAIAIFYVFQAEKALLKEVFPNATDDPQKFQDGEASVFIGQVRRFREGVRLDRAEALIYYTTEFSYLSYEQGRNRLVSKERTEPAHVWFFCSEYGIDRMILDAVHNKQDFTHSYYKKNIKKLTL